MAVGVGVKAFDGEAADLVAAGTALPGDDQRRVLVGVGQRIDGGRQGGEFMLGDEPGSVLGSSGCRSR